MADLRRPWGGGGGGGGLGVVAFTGAVEGAGVRGPPIFISRFILLTGLINMLLYIKQISC
jgi:hypothetical protein